MYLLCTYFVLVERTHSSTSTSFISISHHIYPASTQVKRSKPTTSQLERYRHSSANTHAHENGLLSDRPAIQSKAGLRSQPPGPSHFRPRHLPHWQAHPPCPGRPVSPPRSPHTSIYLVSSGLAPMRLALTHRRLADHLSEVCHGFCSIPRPFRR